MRYILVPVQMLEVDLQDSAIISSSFPFSEVLLPSKALGVDWPPVHHFDTFATCFNDALALQIQKEAEDEAFACALEAQQALGRGAISGCHVTFSVAHWLCLVSWNILILLHKEGILFIW